jgi:hypothetical protein
MRRRGGWGGGDSPSMRNIINPLDSQDMADRAQGVDISSAMPSTRLETQISEPMAESFVTSQLPQPAAPSVAAPSQVAAEFDQPAPRSSPFSTAAGSNAVADPISPQQCPGGVCPPRQSGGLSWEQYGLTPEPGATLIRVDEKPSSSPAPMGAMPSSPAAPSAVGAPQPGQQQSQLNAQVTPGGWASFVQEAAADPKKANWRGFAMAAHQQHEMFKNLVGVTADPKLKAVYWNESQYWGRESANAMRAAILADNLAPRQKLAEKALQGNSLQSQMESGYQFLSTPSGVLRPEDRAAAFARQVNPKLTDEQMEQDPVYQEAAKVAHAGQIAHYAAIAVADDPEGNPWGTQESRDSGMNAAWKAATARYGAMPFEQAVQEIDERFVPAYAQSLGELNARRPEGQQLSDAQIVSQAQQEAVYLRSQLYYAQNPDADTDAPPQQPAAQVQTPPPPQQPAAQPPAGNWQRLKRNTEWMQ